MVFSIERILQGRKRIEIMLGYRSTGILKVHEAKFIKEKKLKKKKKSRGGTEEAKVLFATK